MAWSVSAHQADFEAASAWFASRVPYTREQYDALDDESRKRAFWVSGGLELDAVETIFGESGRAIANGTPLEDFKRDIQAKLEGRLGPDGFHLETVLRNACQNAYNTARWTQLTDPELSLLRPYLLYDSVLDSRTTPICKALDGTCKPVDDTYWLTHHPSMHHRCRSALRSLRTSEAQRRGITTADPLTTGEKPVNVPPGWGKAPPLSDGSEFRPDPEKASRDVQKEARIRTQRADEELAAAKAAAKAAREAKRRQQPKHWVSKYSDKYGEENAKRMAWGKAMEERARAMRPAAFLEASDALAAATPISRARKTTRDALSQMLVEASAVHGEDAVTMGDLFDMCRERPGVVSAHALRELEGHAAMVAHSKAITPRKGAGRVKRFDPEGLTKQELAQAKDEVKHALSFFSAMVDKTCAFDPSIVTVGTNQRHLKRTDRRASYSLRDHFLEYGAGSTRTMVHELGHGLEEMAKTAELSLAFVRARAYTQSARKLRDITGSTAYREDEVALEDEFWSPYVGKEYVYASGKAAASEVLSMTFEGMAADLASVVMHDLDALHFALGIMAGGNAQ